MNKVYFLLGSNTGDRESMLLHAEEQIEATIGPIIKRSAMYQTAAWGITAQPDFYNRVVIAETVLGAEETLARALAAETTAGRVRTVKNGPRNIDIDILFYNDDVIDTRGLTVPHPRIANRRFVLVPMNEIAANFMHPVLKQSMRELLARCTDTLNVQKI